MIKTVKFVTVAIRLKVRWCVCAYFQNLTERRSLLPVETALGLMISFGSLIATIIFGILAVVIKLVTVLNGAVRGVVSATPLFVSIITTLLIFYNQNGKSSSLISIDCPPNGFCEAFNPLLLGVATSRCSKVVGLGLLDD